MTKTQAKRVFIWGTLVSTVIFLALTYNSLLQIPKRTLEDKLDTQVAGGKWRFAIGVLLYIVDFFTIGKEAKKTFPS